MTLPDPAPPTVVVHRQELPPPRVSLTLTRNSRGYGWELSTSGEDPQAVLAVLCQLDAALRQRFGEPT